MKFIALAFMLAVLALTRASSGAANLDEKPPAKMITVCRVEFTGIGKAASFHFNYLYSISTGEDGAVEKITKLAERRPDMVREDKMIECMRTWKLEPSSRYNVVFSVGTTSATDYISIVDPRGDSIKLILP